jgi:acyl dehydratase
MRVFTTFDDVVAAVGEELGASSWLEVTQERIRLFAEATDDHQWIHLDAERAARESPFGTTVAHGYLTLSLVPRFVREVLRFEGVRASVNYGSNKVRFPAPVPAGARLRGQVRLSAAEPVTPDGLRVVLDTVVEIEGGVRPACTAETIALHYW